MVPSTPSTVMSQGCAAWASVTVHRNRSWSESGRLPAMQAGPSKVVAVSGASLGSVSARSRRPTSWRRADWPSGRGSPTGWQRARLGAPEGDIDQASTLARGRSCRPEQQGAQPDAADERQATRCAGHRDSMVGSNPRRAPPIRGSGGARMIRPPDGAPARCSAHRTAGYRTDVLSSAGPERGADRPIRPRRPIIGPITPSSTVTRPRRRP